MQPVCGRLLRQGVQRCQRQACRATNGRCVSQRTLSSVFPRRSCAFVQQRRRSSTLSASAEDEALAGEGGTSEAETVAAALAVSALDIRVGKILEVEKHPDADRLYVEKVDVGEEEPRTIISGLVQFVPLQEMQGRPVVVLANLKPRNMCGIKSHGMLLCASNAAHDQVEPLRPPATAPVGERVFFGEEGVAQPDPASPNKIQKKKIWEELQPKLKTCDSKTADWDGNVMMTSAGPITADNVAGGNIS